MVLYNKADRCSGLLTEGWASRRVEKEYEHDNMMSSRTQCLPGGRGQLRPPESAQGEGVGMRSLRPDSTGSVGLHGPSSDQHQFFHFSESSGTTRVRAAKNNEKTVVKS